MRKYVFFVTILFSIGLQAQVKVEKLLCENKSNPLGVDNLKPQLSWQLTSDNAGIFQKAYEIIISTNKNDFKSKKNVVWESGKIASDQSVHVMYNGTELKSGTRYFWKVRIWDNKGRVSKWSDTAFWLTGLFNISDWKAKWIEPGYIEDTVLRPCPLLRKEFFVNRKIKSATAFITAHGFYKGIINGQEIENAYFTPGWTSYHKRLQYQAYDITSLIKPGKNAIGVILANGWYRGVLTWNLYKNIWGKNTGLLLQIQIEFQDGSKENIISDETWKSSTGSIRYSEIYNGEWIDHRLEKHGWTNIGYNDTAWTPVKVTSYDNSILVASCSEPARKKEMFLPVRIFRTPKNELVVDFGQNLVGIVQMKIRAQRGDSIRITHAEVLDKQGNFYTDNLRSAKQEDIFIPAGSTEEVFEPRFTYMGFRYVRIQNYKGDIKPGDLKAYAVYADMNQTGIFSCSDTLINKLQHNIRWSQKGNFVDVPTDCPQRDERLGWTGDAEVFFPTGAFNMQIDNFFEKWMKDVSADQLKNGSIPATIPNPFINYPQNDMNGTCGWGDVATIVPWDMYVTYGNKRILENQYNSMKRWVDFITSKSENYLWTKGWHFGDWLSIVPTDNQLIAQCFYIYSTDILTKSAKLLKKDDDFTFYSELLKKEKEAFVNEYLTPNGRLISDTQTAYVLALQFDIVPSDRIPQLIQRLVNKVHENKDHLSTGFLGTPYLCKVLSRFGYPDLAYKLLFQTDYPSWLYQVKAGATTIWERWDGQKTDGNFQDKGMNSFNHYAYGAIGDWLYKNVAGINPDDSIPGYKHIIIKPYPGGGLTFATAELETYYGKIVSAWKIDGNSTFYTIVIPCNTYSTIYLPVKDAKQIYLNNKAIKMIADKNDLFKTELNSGKYEFRIDR